jgi:hypothetical protein
MIKIYLNSKYFDIIANALEYIFRQNNNNSELQKIDYQIVDNIEECDDIYIIFNPKFINPMPKKYIIYNFEQLENINLNDEYITKFRNAIEIWEYSNINVKYLKDEYNIDSIFFPMGWTPTMYLKKIDSWSNRVNTIGFIGAINEKRINFLRPIHKYLKENNLNVYISDKCWNEEYLYICSITKIFINIHYYSNKTILEVHRIIPLILSEIWICSEKSNDEWYDNLFDELVDWIDVNNSTQIINNVINKSVNEINIILKERKIRLIEKLNYYKIFYNIKSIIK